MNQDFFLYYKTWVQVGIRIPFYILVRWTPFYQCHSLLVRGRINHHLVSPPENFKDLWGSLSPCRPENTTLYTTGPVGRLKDIEMYVEFFIMSLQDTRGMC